MRKTYQGADIEVSFDLDRCIHVGACLLGLPEVFDLHRRPWIEPDRAPAEAVVAVVERCPSGALQYRRLDGGPAEAHPATTVQQMRNGPLVVTGEIQLTHADGSHETLPRATLCRCGASQRKPFCDNSHLQIGFTAPGQPFRISRSEVRPQVREPMPTAADPRGVEDGGR